MRKEPVLDQDRNWGGKKLDQRAGHPERGDLDDGAAGLELAVSFD